MSSLRHRIAVEFVLLLAYANPLRQFGVRVFPESEVGVPALYITVHLLRFNENVTMYSKEVELRENMYLERRCKNSLSGCRDSSFVLSNIPGYGTQLCCPDGAFMPLVVVWEAESIGYVGIDMVRSFSIMGLVDEFINAYLSLNPNIVPVRPSTK